VGTALHSAARIFATANTWIEGEAVSQLERAAALPGMRLVVGLPDLHPGKGIPIGAAFFNDAFLYPELVGSDIGCGMTLVQTDLLARKSKLDAWVRRLDVMDAAWSATDTRVDVDDAMRVSRGLGSVGGGNHFAELLAVDSIENLDVLTAHAVDDTRLLLLVHSGSRALGDGIWRAHAARHGGTGLPAHSEAAQQYLRRHDDAVAWARVNRAVVAERFLDAVHADGRTLLDLVHNAVVPAVVDGRMGHLHRKGAAPADGGLVVLPGSRGSKSYLLMPTALASTTSTCALSLAHGAGRKWRRGECEARLSARFSPESLTRNAWGGRVVCVDKALLYEEAPPAYKDVDDVVDSLVQHGLVHVVASLRPVLTFKTSVREGRDA
jgi:release factor H-coupled RctB family protein